jgi:hypothetical protein
LRYQAFDDRRIELHVEECESAWNIDPLGG